MSTTIHDVLDELRTTAMSEADGGSEFEWLAKARLTTDPLCAEQLVDASPPPAIRADQPAGTS